EQLVFEHGVAQAEVLKPVTELKSLYQKGLMGLRAAKQESGALGYVLEIDAEIKRLENDEMAAVGPQFPEIERLQKIYLENRDKRLNDVQPLLTQLEAEFRAKLSALQVSLTRQNLLDKAIAVKKTLDELPPIGQPAAKTATVTAPTPPPAETTKGAADNSVFNLKTGSYFGLAMGTSEAEARKYFEKEGMKITNEFSSNGVKGIGFDGLSFRFDESGKLFEIYNLNPVVQLPERLKLGKSKVEDFEKVLNAQATKDKTGGGKDCFVIESASHRLMLLLVDGSEDTVF
ncbi:MAG: hypothetical protein KDM64_19310, partial [Verrucomicrobiae bacterium]|nr:hypothetical protein [Verrucomicrobiae bacterium]